MKMAAQTTCGMTVATVGAVVIAYYMFTKISRKRMPPGPTPLPFSTTDAAANRRRRW